METNTHDHRRRGWSWRRWCWPPWLFTREQTASRSPRSSALHRVDRCPCGSGCISQCFHSSMDPRNPGNKEAFSQLSGLSNKIFNDHLKQIHFTPGWVLMPSISPLISIASVPSMVVILTSLDTSLQPVPLYIRWFAQKYHDTITDQGSGQNQGRGSGFPQQFKHPSNPLWELKRGVKRKEEGDIAQSSVSNH